MKLSAPDVVYLKALESNLSRISNGRYVHKRDSLRQSLLFYVSFIETGTITDKMVVELTALISNIKSLIREVWELECQMIRSG